jgi:hypothetical protein
MKRLVKHDFKQKLDGHPKSGRVICFTHIQHRAILQIKKSKDDYHIIAAAMNLLVICNLCFPHRDRNNESMYAISWCTFLCSFVVGVGSGLLLLFRAKREDRR